MACEKYLILAVIYAFCCLASADTAANLTISLDKATSSTNNQLYGEFVTLSATSSLLVNFVNPNTNVTFIIFQVHSHLYNITLSNGTSVHSQVSGTNVGMYSSAQHLDSFTVLNKNNIDLKLYLAVLGYGSKDPIPGGCNMELPLPISPFLQTSYNDDYILLDAAAPKAYNETTCKSAKELTFYRMYLPEMDLTEDVYFDGIRSMMTVDKILDNGEVIPQTGVMWNMRRMLAAYPGTGSIYVAIAYAPTGQAVYVPTYTYACNPLDVEGCYLLDDVLSQFLCAGLLFIGAFICYFGHQFFRIEMFLIGLTSGAIVTYIILTIIADLDRRALIGASILSGLCFGGIWLIFWWMYGIPVLAVLLATLNLGFLAASIMYYKIPGGIASLEINFNFWSLFIMVMIFVATLLISMTLLSNILCCCVMGAYAVVFSIDYYLGSSLKYILINIVRRAVVPLFNRAVVSAPFELSDALLTLLWVALALTGFLMQHYNSKGRPPFPPPPRAIGTRMPSPDAGPRFYGSLSRPSSRPGSRPTSRPVSRSGSRTFYLPQAVVHALATQNQAGRSSESTPLIY